MEHDMKEASPRMRVREVAKELSCCVSTVWAWVKAGYLPQPNRVGSRFTYWLRSDIEAIARNQQIAKEQTSQQTLEVSM